MAEISRINMGGAYENVSAVNMFNEHACGIIFDISSHPEVFATHSKARNLFYNMVTEVKVDGNLEIDYGIDKQLMNGIPYYHLNMYKQIQKDNNSSQPIYVMFADLTDLTPLDRMGKLTHHQLFQIGIWTEQSLSEQLLDMFKDKILSYTNRAADIDKSENSTPFNVLLSCNYAVEKSHRTLPDLASYDIPALTVLLSQENSEEVHTIQGKTANKTPVGCIGLALGTLAISDAEFSIADNSKFDLSKYIPKIELGMGKNNTPIDNELQDDNLIHYFRNQLAKKGYVFVIDKDDLSGNYFCNDQTLGHGDYNSLSRCRVCCKVNRIVFRVMLKYVNKGFHLQGPQKTADIAYLQNDIYTAVRSYMGESSGGTGYAQIGGLLVNVDFDSSLLKNHKLKVEVIITQVKDSKQMNVSATTNVN